MRFPKKVLKATWETTTISCFLPPLYFLMLYLLSSLLLFLNFDFIGSTYLSLFHVNTTSLSKCFSCFSSRSLILLVIYVNCNRYFFIIPQHRLIFFSNCFFTYFFCWDIGIVPWVFYLLEHHWSPHNYGFWNLIKESILWIFGF